MKYRFYRLVTKIRKSCSKQELVFKGTRMKSKRQQNIAKIILLSTPLTSSTDSSFEVIFSCYCEVDANGTIRIKLLIVEYFKKLPVTDRYSKILHSWRLTSTAAHKV